NEAMGDFGRLTSVDQLPGDRVMISYIRKAVALNEQGIKKAPRTRKPPARLTSPDDLRLALSKNKKAREAFDRFSYSHRKEYLAMDWISQGKPQNWKYMVDKK
ncbi:MAG: YdeI/OmpD-associated family protein, partial [Chthoniobacterales bacterium]